jgi:hypothetical protein
MVDVCDLPLLSFQRLTILESVLLVIVIEVLFNCAAASFFTLIFVAPCTHLLQLFMLWVKVTIFFFSEGMFTALETITLDGNNKPIQVIIKNNTSTLIPIKRSLLIILFC